MKVFTPLFFLLLHARFFIFAHSQPLNKEEEKKQEEIQVLRAQIKSHPDTIDTFFSSRKEDYKKEYSISYPSPEDYVIHLLINPCGYSGEHGVGLRYDCCMNRFGQGEYGILTNEALESQGRSYPEYRIGISDIPIMASSQEVQHNLIWVDEFGTPLQEWKHADDFRKVDTQCKDLRDPDPDCFSKHIRAVKTNVEAACTDHNQTVDSSLGCYDSKGDHEEHCMQVAYSQTAFIPACSSNSDNDSSSCGTFLEIHRPNGSPYDPDETTVLSERKITTPITNEGMITTTLSLLYQNDPNRILCNYKETKIRIGSMVLINNQAPKCCCPPSYISRKKTGSFWCPKTVEKQSTNKQGAHGGPFATDIRSVSDFISFEKNEQLYPYCHYNPNPNEDTLYCSTQSKVFTQDIIGPSSDTSSMNNGRHYTYPCETVQYNSNTRIYSSQDLYGNYRDTGFCPYGGTAFQSCVLSSEQTQDNSQSTSSCQGNDSRFTFSGHIGKVVSIPSSSSSSDNSNNANNNSNDNIQYYGVTFNDGRTSYTFPQHELELISSSNDSNYEIWFVQRIPKYGRIIQKKKKFHVQYPKCTYDEVNDEYFPFKQL